MLASSFPWRLGAPSLENPGSVPAGGGDGVANVSSELLECFAIILAES